MRFIQVNKILRNREIQFEQHCLWFDYGMIYTNVLQIEILQVHICAVKIAKIICGMIKNCVH